MQWALPDVLRSRHISVAELLRMMPPDRGVSDGQIYRLASSSGSPDLINVHTLDLLCTALDLPTSALLRWKPDRSSGNAGLDIVSAALAQNRAAHSQTISSQCERLEVLDNVKNEVARTWGLELTPKLASILERDKGSDELSNLTWRITARGREAFQSDFDTSAVLWDSSRVELATNIGGYAVGHFGPPGDEFRGFHFTTGSGGSHGFRDWSTFGNILAAHPNNYLWKNVTL